MKRTLAATALVAALTAGGAAITPSALAAAPRTASAVSPAYTAGFYAGGVWTLYQNNGWSTTVNLAQDTAGMLYGSATSGSYVGTVTSGYVSGNLITFVISWSSGSIGSYTGALGTDRRLSGTTVDLAHPTSQASWYTLRTF